MYWIVSVGIGAAAAFEVTAFASIVTERVSGWLGKEGFPVFPPVDGAGTGVGRDCILASLLGIARAASEESDVLTPCCWDNPDSVLVCGTEDNCERVERLLNEVGPFDLAKALRDAAGCELAAGVASDENIEAELRLASALNDDTGWVGADALASELSDDTG